MDAHLTRYELDGTVEEKDGQQFVGGRGYAADRFERVLRLESHGFASHPVKGGQATILTQRGWRDAAYAIGGENPQLRPQLPAGASALYDSEGNIIKLIGTGAVFDFGARTATFTAGNWTINGPVTIVGDLHVDGNITATGTITP